VAWTFIETFLWVARGGAADKLVRCNKGSGRLRREPTRYSRACEAPAVNPPKAQVLCRLGDAADRTDRAGRC